MNTVKKTFLVLLSETLSYNSPKIADSFDFFSKIKLISLRNWSSFLGIEVSIEKNSLDRTKRPENDSLFSLPQKLALVSAPKCGPNIGPSRNKMSTFSGTTKLRLDVSHQELIQKFYDDKRGFSRLFFYSDLCIGNLILRNLQEQASDKISSLYANSYSSVTTGLVSRVKVFIEISTEKMSPQKTNWFGSLITVLTVLIFQKLFLNWNNLETETQKFCSMQTWSHVWRSESIASSSTIEEVDLFENHLSGVLRQEIDNLRNEKRDAFNTSLYQYSNSFPQ